jgi:hypothetical protein
MDLELSSFSYSELLSVVRKSNIPTKGRLKKIQIIELIENNQEVVNKELLELRATKHRSILDTYLIKEETEHYKNYYLHELYSDDQDLWNAVYYKNKEAFDWLLSVKTKVNLREVIHEIITRNLVEYAKSFVSYISSEDIKDFLGHCLSIPEDNESRRILFKTM